MTTDLTDEQILAELLPDETQWFRTAVGATDYPLTDTLVYLRRLAEARIEAREAAARERERIAGVLEADAESMRTGGSVTRTVYRNLAGWLRTDWAHRARGGAA